MQARNGIGIILSKEWQDKILEIKCISDRIMTMKLVSGNTMLNLISVYAPGWMLAAGKISVL